MSSDARGAARRGAARVPGEGAGGAHQMSGTERAHAGTGTSHTSPYMPHLWNDMTT